MALGIPLLCALVGFVVGAAMRAPVARLVAGSPTPVLPRAVVVRSRAPAGVVLGAVTAAVFTVLACRLRPGLDLVAFLAVATGGVVLASVDLRTLRLPGAVTGGIWLAGLALLGIEALARDEVASYVRALTGSCVLAAYHFGLAVCRRGALGIGDVKLAAVLGLHLSWLGWGELVVGAMLSFVGAGASAAVLVATGRARRDTELPFGPWMLAGALGGVLVGGAPFEAYATW